MADLQKIVDDLSSLTVLEAAELAKLLEEAELPPGILSVLIGGGSVVHQFTRMGAISLLQGLSAISKDIPPFSIAMGRNAVSTINVVGLRRAGFGPELRKEVKDAFGLFYRSGLNSTQALEEARKRSWSKEVSLFWDFVATSKRGICSMVRWKDARGASTAEE